MSATLSLPDELGIVYKKVRLPNRLDPNIRLMLGLVTSAYQKGKIDITYAEQTIAAIKDYEKKPADLEWKQFLSDRLEGPKSSKQELSRYEHELFLELSAMEVIGIVSHEYAQYVRDQVAKVTDPALGYPELLTIKREIIDRRTSDDTKNRFDWNITHLPLSIFPLLNEGQLKMIYENTRLSKWHRAGSYNPKKIHHSQDKILRELMNVNKPMTA